MANPDEPLTLEGIGLTNSESKVYLSLLKLGASSSGPLVKDSGTADSKIYVVLDKLTSKGLVSSFIKDGVRHFRAASPTELVNYLDERQERIKSQLQSLDKLMPMMRTLEESGMEEREASVFSGFKGERAGYRKLVSELERGEEIHIMGTYSFPSNILPVVLYFQKIRSKKGIKAKFLINSGAGWVAELFRKFPPAEIKFLPEEILTPTIFLIYHDTVIINLLSELTMFVIKGKSAAKAFDSYFNYLWKVSSKQPNSSQPIEKKKKVSRANPALS